MYQRPNCPYPYICNCWHIWRCSFPVSILNYQILRNAPIKFKNFGCDFWKELPWYHADFLVRVAKILIFIKKTLQIIVQSTSSFKISWCRTLCQNTVIKIGIWYVCMKLLHCICFHILRQVPFKMWSWTGCLESFGRWTIYLTILCIRTIISWCFAGNRRWYIRGRLNLYFATNLLNIKLHAREETK